MNTHDTSSPTALLRTHAAQAEALLKQLANANRLMVLCQLVGGEKSVGELAKSVDLSHSALSQHLAKLREAGLVSATKRGLMVYYRIHSAQAQALLGVLHVMFCKT